MTGDFPLERDLAERTTLVFTTLIVKSFTQLPGAAACAGGGGSCVFTKLSPVATLPVSAFELRLAREYSATIPRPPLMLSLAATVDAMRVQCLQGYGIIFNASLARIKT
jgi:hypothetical protein